MAENKSKADIVLIRPNGKAIMYHGLETKTTAVDPPYWLAAMGGWLSSRDIEVVLIDAEAAGQTPEETAKQVASLKPKLVGVFTLGSNLTASTWTMPGAGILCQAIKHEEKEIPVFLWGNHPSALPERTLREEVVDFVIVGEGFRAVEQLYSYLNNGWTLHNEIQGVQYLEDDMLCGNGSVSVIEDLSRIPVDGWDLFPEDQRHYRNHLHFAFEDFSKRDQYGAILTSLGCPYNCTYCAVRTFSGNTRRVRYKTPEAALLEVDWWVKHRNAYYLRILDECFTANRNFAMEFSKKLAERKYDLSIWINARIKTVDEELLHTMRSAGIKWIGYGIESISDKVRKESRKDDYSFNEIKEAVRLTQDGGISICGNIMFGLPGETTSDMEADLMGLRELNVEYPNMYCTMAYPGSVLYRETLKNHPEWLPDTWAGYAQLAYETQPLPTEFLSAAQVLKFRDYAFGAYFKDNEPYFSMIRNKFGQSAVDAIHKVLDGGKMKRKLLGD